MDVEEVMRQARATEQELVEALILNSTREDDEESISSVLDDLDDWDIFEQHLQSKHAEFDDNNQHSTKPFILECILKTPRGSETSTEEDINIVETPEDCENEGVTLRRHQELQTDVHNYEQSLRGSILDYIVETPETPTVSSEISFKEWTDDESQQYTEIVDGESARGSILEYIVEEPAEPSNTVEEIDLVEEKNTKKTKENIKLNYIVEELISTEIDYMKSLHFLLLNFLKPIRNVLKTRKEKIIAQKMCNYTKMIHRLGTNFLDDLVQVEIHLIGDVILQHRTLFNLYTKLSRVWNDFMKIVREPTIDEFIKNLELTLHEALGFSRYILKPMQRLPKYELLLNQMPKQMADMDISGIEEAGHFVKDVLNRCNTIVALESIKYQKYTVQEAGNYIMKTDLKWRVVKRQKKLVKPVELFLFEKVVIIAVDVDGVLQYRDSILLSKLTRVDLLDPLRFTLEEIHRSSKRTRTIKLEAPSPQAKQKCLQSIDDLLWEELNRLKQQAKLLND